MSKLQPRRSISISARAYDRLRDLSKKRRVTMAEIVERGIEAMGGIEFRNDAMHEASVLQRLQEPIARFVYTDLRKIGD